MDLPEKTVPDPATFRAWLGKVLPLLTLTPSGLSKDLGLGRNALGEFMASRTRDIRLGTAASVHAEIQRRALKAGRDLPPIGGRLDG